ncbi:F-box/kelch-repeat protein [Trifolium repens]|nr:F-box/kelch-repeat protein [Trifolium repens]
MAPGTKSDLPNNTISILPLTEETTSAKRRRLTISTGILISAPLPTLPIDLIIIILCKLPMRFLRQLRCICKSWKALISDPTFRMEYLRLLNTHHLIMVSFRSNLKKFLTDLESILSYTKTQLTYPNSLKNKYGTPLFMHSCDGLLCFITNISYVILWNPSIRAFKILPPPSKNLRERRYISSSYSFGYDRFIDDYKIVAISFFKDKVEVNIYILGRNSWRRIQEFPHCSSIRGPGVFVSGTVNWLTFYDSSSTSCAIVSLDLEEESYQKLSQPDLEKNH